MKAYLQHKGGENGPFSTESVDVKTDFLPWQKMGLQYTSTGYGKRIPTIYKVKHENKWRRVYCCIFSNAGTLYIGKLSKKAIIVQIEN